MRVPEQLRQATNPHVPSGRKGFEVPDACGPGNQPRSLELVPDVKGYYDAKYTQPNYFHQSEWLYAPYIAGLISFAGLKRGSFVLDVGCGQGLLSYLFHKCGMRVHGIDISETGVRIAENRYGRLGVTFEAVDINAAVFPVKFDCIFVRSCSLHNTEQFAETAEVTSSLLNHLKPEGVLIFAYNSNFSSKSVRPFRCHSLHDVKEHFRRYPNGKVFFTTKLDALMLGKYAFTGFMTRMNILLSKACGIGGDLVCVLKNPSRS
jgi:SAM-dependent methyltransferase